MRARGTSLSEAEKGFPWERVRFAQSFLHAVKPFWSRFGSRFTIVPMYTPPKEGNLYGGLTATLPDLTLFIDRKFASKAPIEELAAAIEHEYMHHTADTWNRLSAQSELARSRWLNIVTDLEINAQITTSYEKVGADEVYLAVDRSKSLTVEDLSKWGITGPPRLPKGCWSHTELGVGAMTAEEYFDLLYKVPDPDDGGGDSDSDNNEDDNDDSGNEDSNSEEGEGDSGDDAGADMGDSNGGDTPADEPKAGDEGEQGGGNADTKEAGQGEDEEKAGGEGGRPGVDLGPEDGPQGDPDDAPPAEQGSTTDSAGAGGAREGEPQQDTSGDSEASPGSNEQGQGEKTLAEKINELRDQEEHKWWSEDMGYDEDGDPASWRPKDYQRKSLSTEESQRSEALTILADDIIETSESTIHANKDFMPDPKMLKFAKKNSSGARREVEIGGILSSVLSTSVRGAAIKGLTDLSYSVRNPNQPDLGPIMKGSRSYAPTLYFVMDVSGSMIPHMQRYMQVFNDVAESVMATYSSPVIWITIDFDVRSVGKDFSMNDLMENSWGFGFGTTDIGSLLLQLVEGEFEWEGERYPKSDVIFLASDCEWDWPWNNHDHPHKPFNSELVVASTNSWKTASRVYGVPDWVNDGQRYIHLPSRGR